MCSLAAAHSLAFAAQLQASRQYCSGSLVANLTFIYLFCSVEHCFFMYSVGALYFPWFPVCRFKSLCLRTANAISMDGHEGRYSGPINCTNNPFLFFFFFFAFWGSWLGSADVLNFLLKCLFPLTLLIKRWLENYSLPQGSGLTNGRLAVIIYLSTLLTSCLVLLLSSCPPFPVWGDWW